jgi:diaminopimelate epimerase
LQISKYSASGNDFVIFHTFHKKDRTELAQRLCNRFNGIGADGLIVIVPHHDFSFEWQFYNADGSEAAMCGNGSRAAAHYAFKEGLAPAQMKFLTGAGVITAEVESDLVESELTLPNIFHESMEEGGRQWFFVDTGVPHLVTEMQDYDEYDQALAAKMRHAHNANVNYVMEKDGALHVRTYERGVEDETLACGTGMAAAFLYMNRLGRVGESAKVYPPSKEELTLRKEGERLFLKGNVVNVFDVVKNLKSMLTTR